jgi:Skp family chaperone for outer membrane proteins
VARGVISCLRAEVQRGVQLQQQRKTLARDILDLRQQREDLEQKPRRTKAEMEELQNLRKKLEAKHDEMKQLKDRQKGGTYQRRLTTL